MVLALLQALRKHNEGRRLSELLYPLGEERAAGGPSPRLTHHVKDTLAAFDLAGAASAGDWIPTQDEAFVASQLYSQLAWLHSLERIGGEDFVAASRVRGLFPQNMRPGQPPPDRGRRFTVPLAGSPGLTSDPLVAAMATLDPSLKLVVDTAWTVRIERLASARHAWVVLRVARVPFTDLVRMSVNSGAGLDLMTAGAADSTLLCHGVPLWMLAEGENRFQARLNSLCSRREGTLRGLIDFTVVLAP